MKNVQYSVDADNNNHTLIHPSNYAPIIIAERDDMTINGFTVEQVNDLLLDASREEPVPRRLRSH